MNKEYYKIDSKIDTEETGNIFPAIESAKGYDFNASNSVYKLRSDIFPTFEPNFEFILSKGAKEVDILSQGTISANGLVVSQRLKQFFKNYITVPQMSFELRIQNTKSNYYWIQYMWNESKSFVDFEKTTFKISEFGNLIEAEKKITNVSEFEDYQNQLGNFKLLYPTNLYLVDNNFDIITLPYRGGIGVSNSVKNDLIKNGFTGFELREIN